MRKFYGREKQRRLLHRLFVKEEQQTVLIFGRRRVGKSELIKQSLRETELTGIYYECRQTTEQNNTDSICQLLSETYHYPKPAFQSIEALLDYLFQSSADTPLIFVLDEYPYLREVVTGLDSILQALIDKYRDTSSLKLILCGSYVDVMKSLLMKENPLYGRVDHTIDLKPMDYYESAMFYPSFSDEDKVRLYSVFGGIPYYNRMIDSSLSVRENMIELIASPDARLENEVGMYLKSEISKINNANEVFGALAKGYSRFSDLLSQSHVSSSPTLADVLDKLIRMEVVKKEAPINDENNKRKAGYYITDNLSLFYYRYIFRFSSQLRILDPDIFFDRYIAEDFETKYVPHIFEDICRQYLIRQNRLGLMEVPFDRIGKYYYYDPATRTNGEFDVVTQGPLGYIFYEAKFRREPVTLNMIEKELRQVQAAGLVCYWYGFFSRSGFQTAGDDRLKLICLSEMYPQPPT